MFKLRKITAILLAVALLLGTMPLSLLASAESTVPTLEVFSDGEHPAENNGYWVFEKRPDGNLSIRNDGTGYYLAAEGTTLVLEEKNEADANQCWRIDEWGNIVSVGNSAYTCFNGIELVDGGASCGIWPEGTVPYWSSNPANSDNMIAGSAVVEGTKYMLGLAQWSGNFLGVEGIAEEPEVPEEPEVIYQDQGFVNASEVAIYNGYWIFENKGSGVVAIKNATTEKYLALVEGDVCLIDYKENDDHQLWNFGEYAGTLNISNKATSEFLSVIAANAGTVSKDGSSIGIWPEGTTPAWTADNTYTNNGLTSINQMVYGDKYMLGNSNWNHNFLGAVSIETDEPDEPDEPEKPEVIYQDNAFNVPSEVVISNGYWIFENKGSGVVAIKNDATEKYLAVVEDDVCLLDYKENDDRQLWIFGEYAGTLNLRNKAASKYLEVSFASGGGTLSDGGASIGIWPEGTTPAWTADNTYTNNGLTSINQMVYGDKYMLGNSNWEGNYIGAVDVAIEGPVATYPDQAFNKDSDVNLYNGYWIFENHGGSAVGIKNATTGKYLAAVDGNVCLVEYNLKDARQIWNLGEYEGTLNLQNKATSQFLVITASSGGGTLSDGGSSIGIWPEGTTPAWTADNTYTNNGLTSVSQMVYGDKYMLGNSHWGENFLGAKEVTITFNGITPVMGAVNVPLNGAICFKATYEYATNKKTTIEIPSGEDNILAIANDDGSLYIEGVTLGEATIRVTSIENPNVSVELTVYVTGKPGDVNSDGNIDILDLIGAKKYLAGIGNKSNFDLDADGDADLIDMVMLRKYLLGNLSLETENYVNEAITFNLTSGRAYDNPYTEVSVNALFEGPNGEKLTVPAYWAGGTTFKVRFAPTSEGTWTYTTACTNKADRGLNGKTGTFEVKNNPSANDLLKHGRLKVSSSGDYLVHTDGTPFFWLADTSWFAMGERGDFETVFKPIVDKRAEQGYTAFQSILWVSSTKALLQHYNEGGMQWNNDALWRDLNPEYWNWVEKRVQYLVDKGIVPVLGFDWGGSVTAENLEDYKRVVRYAIARLSAYPVVWVVAGECCAHYDADKAYQANYDALGYYIDSVDPYGNLTTVHDTREYQDDFITSGWCDFIMSEGGHNAGEFDYCDWDIMSESAANAGKPWLEAEAKYEKITTHVPDETRMIAYLAVMNGSFGYSYGAEGLWELTQDENDFYQNENSMWIKTPIPWYDALEFEGGTTWMPNFKNIFTSLPWWSLKTNPAGVTFKGVNTDDGVAMPVAKANDDKSCTVIYLPMTSNSDFTTYTVGANASVTVSGLKNGATYEANFYNTKDLSVVAATVTRNGDSITVDFPADLAENDYVLVVKEAGVDFGNGVEAPETEVALKVYNDGQQPVANNGYWVFEKGTDGYYGIRNVATGYYLASSGTTLVLVVKNEADANQRWQIDMWGNIVSVGNSDYTCFNGIELVAGGASCGIWPEGTVPYWSSNPANSDNMIAGSAVVEGTKYMLGLAQWSGNYLGVEGIAAVITGGETEMPESYTVPVGTTVISFNKANAAQGTNGVYYGFYEHGFGEFENFEAPEGFASYWGEYIWGSSFVDNNDDGNNDEVGNSEFITDNLMCAGEYADAVVYWQADAAGTVTIDSYLLWSEIWAEDYKGDKKYGSNVQIILRTPEQAENYEYTVLAEYNMRSEDRCENAHFYDNIKVSEGDQIMIKVAYLEGYHVYENQVKPNTTLYFVAD